MFRASTLLYPDSGDIFLQSTTLPDVTQLLAEWRTADDTAIDKLIPLVYGELHRMARSCMRDQPAWHALNGAAQGRRPDDMVQVGD